MTPDLHSLTRKDIEVFELRKNLVSKFVFINNYGHLAVSDIFCASINLCTCESADNRKYFFKDSGEDAHIQFDAAVIKIEDQVS